MTTLQAQKRSLEIKAKKLRRQGLTTGVLFGRGMEESIPLQFSENDILRFMKTNKTGAQVILEMDGKKISAVVKNIDFDPIKKQVTALDFQALVSGETISTTVQVNVINDAENHNHINQVLTEILYKAAPANLLDTINIDVQQLSPETRSFYVRDLNLEANEGVKLITPEDTQIFHIENPRNTAAQADEAAAEEAGSEAAEA